MYSFGELLKRFRQRQSLNQGELANKLGVHRNSISDWERSEYLPRTREMVLDLADALDLNNTDIDQLLRAAQYPTEYYAEENVNSATTTLPIYAIPDPAPLPSGSLMPLSRNPHFVGRERDLRALTAALNTGGVAAVNQIKIAATSGLGGIGKTQLACEFVHRYGQFYVGGIYWLSFEDAEAIPAQIAACGGPGALDLFSGFSNLSLDDQVRLVQSAWQRPLPCLLIFDNCEDPRLLDRWRPSSGGCQVLITTRQGDWEPVLGVQTLALGVLNREESLTLLRYHCPNTDEVVLDAIAEELGDLPLALHLAGNYLYLYRRVVSPINYLKQLQDLDLLHHPSFQTGGISPTGHIQHIGRTFALSYDHLDPNDETDAIALALLVRAAHFAPGEPIWYELLVKTFAQYLNDAISPIKIERGFSRLISLGLIETEQDDILRMHRLVAEFVRYIAKDEVKATQKLVETVVFEETARVNQKSYPTPLFAWQLHLRSVTDIAKVREDERGARLCNEMGEHLRQIGDYDGARPYLEKALTIWEKTVGKEDLNTAEALNNVGRLLRDQGILTEARPYLEQALAIRKKKLGEEHPDVAESLNHMGRWLYLQKDLDLARSYLERALAISLNVLGEEHPLTADYFNNVGMCLRSMGEFVKARKHLEQALVIRQKVLGEEHPRTALSLNNMGWLLETMEKLEKAKPYYEKALAIRQKTLGKDHPRVTESLYCLGTLLRAQGDLAGAQSYLDQALKVCEKAFGKEHHSTAYCLNNLGLLMQAQGDLDQARLYFEQALTIRRKVLGKEHPDVAETLSHLGALLKIQGNLVGAQSYYERAFAILESHFGPNHIDTHRVQNNLTNLKA